MFPCKKCPYFQKAENKLQHGVVILGFCRLRKKSVSDRSIGGEQCKDRAVVDL
jgi:hypothetical protein